MVQLFMGVIEAWRKAASSSTPQRTGDGTDILTIFMELKYKDGTTPTIDEITGLLIAPFVFWTTRYCYYLAIDCSDHCLSSTNYEVSGRRTTKFTRQVLLSPSTLITWF